MRTTLQIDDDVLSAARAIARTQNRSLGNVVSNLARKGLRPEPSESVRDGFPIFEVTADAQPITDEMVAAALDDET